MAVGAGIGPAIGLHLHAGKVSVLIAGVDDVDHDLCRSMLSEEECARADRFKFAADRKRFIVGRGLLRRIAGDHLGVAGGSIRFLPGPNGKLRIDAPIEFSVSHSGEWVAIAFSPNARVGIDVQENRALHNEQGIVRRCLTPTEFSRTSGLEPPVQLRAFYDLWVLKEAYLKGTGFGLTKPMDGIEIAGIETRQPALASVSWDDLEPRRWRLHTLQFDPCYACGIAVEGNDPLSVQFVQASDKNASARTVAPARTPQR